MIVHPTFQTWNCAHERIFLRADLNVPLINGTIINDQRLQAIQPTLDYLLKKKTQIILASHIGRPDKHDAALSTHHLMQWFQKNNYTIQFAQSITDAQNIPFEQNTIILLENLRFFAEEKKQSAPFADHLATLAPWYVNDAFASLHRTDTSLALLAQRYAPTHRSIGFLIEKELTILSRLKNNPTPPVCFILGGGKVADKLPLIEALLDSANTIVLCPALVFTFLKAIKKPTGLSLVDDQLLNQARIILKKAQTNGGKIVFPVDYQVADGNKDGPLSFVDADHFPANSMGISIGPKTVSLIQNIITNANTIFYNGMMGFHDREETLTGMKAIMRALSESSATTVVAGGDSITLVDQLHLDGITYCITGGGSTLAYLSDEKLPGLEPFLKNRTKTNDT